MQRFLSLRLRQFRRKLFLKVVLDFTSYITWNIFIKWKKNNFESGNQIFTSADSIS